MDRNTFTSYFDEHYVGDDIGIEMHPNLDQFIRTKRVKDLLKWEEIKIN